MVSCYWDEGWSSASAVFKSKYLDFKIQHAFHQSYPADGSKDFMSASWIISDVVIVILCDKCWIDLIILAHLLLKEKRFC